ncbi:MAG: hypothetical protein ACQEP7_03085 [bacterium]
MANEEIQKVARLVVQSLLDKNYLVETDSPAAEKAAKKAGGEEDSPAASSGGDDSDNLVKPEPGQVLTADKVRNLSGGNCAKIVIPMTTIVTDLAREEADKQKLEIVRE